MTFQRTSCLCEIIVSLPNKRWLVDPTLKGGPSDVGDKDCRDGARNLILDCEYTLQLAIVAFRPAMRTRGHIDQLSSDANMIADPPHAPFKYVLDTWHRPAHFCDAEIQSAI